MKFPYLAFTTYFYQGRPKKRPAQRTINGPYPHISIAPGRRSAENMPLHSIIAFAPLPMLVPMDSAQIRHRNFLSLFQRFKDANPHLPHRGMLKLFAERIGLSERYLSHLKCARKNMGGQVARNIESALGLQHGWMDSLHAENASDDETDAAERLFLDTAKALYRSNPERARKALLDLLQAQLIAPK